LAPDDSAIAKNKNAKKEQAMGAILRIMFTALPPWPVLTPLILKRVKKGTTYISDVKGPALDSSKERKEKTVK
jgi:hypothetical protein